MAVSVAHMRLAVGIVVSSLVHAASTGLMERAPPAGVRVPEVVQFELALEAPAEALTVPARVPAVPPVPPTRAARRSPVRHASDESAAVEQPAPVPIVEPEPAPPAQGAGQKRAVDLSPLAAARTLVDVRAAPGATSETSQKSASEHAPSTSDLAEGIPGLSPSGHQPFDTHARRTVNAALRPWSLLMPLPRGAYYYDGKSFDAVIRKDGSVAYREKDGVHLGITQTQLVTQEAVTGKPPSDSSHANKPFKQMGIAGGLALPDPERWLEWLAGSPRNQLEQRAFLEQTQALREQLMAHSTEAARARAEREMERELSRIWSDAELDLTQRMRKTFALWDECADDEVGAIMRTKIEAYVRARRASSADCAASDSLLRELNATRKSRTPFAPCGR